MVLTLPSVTIGFVAAVAAIAGSALHASAEPLVSCDYSNRNDQAWASGDIAICGPCLDLKSLAAGRGACASAMDIVP